MATRLFAIVVGSNDHVALARWWAEALRTPVVEANADEAWLSPPNAPELSFVPIPERKTAKNRIHVDLATYSQAEHGALVAQLLGAGATHVDVGQAEEEDPDWVVLADPEGNELCVVEPRPARNYDGALASITFETPNPDAVVDLWIAATGWSTFDREPWRTRLRTPSGRGPYLNIVDGGGAKDGVNRVHLDVAPFQDDDHGAEVDRLVAAGARRVDIGQGDVPWVVLADADGNELCVLTPR